MENYTISEIKNLLQQDIDKDRGSGPWLLPPEWPGGAAAAAKGLPGTRERPE